METRQEIPEWLAFIRSFHRIDLTGKVLKPSMDYIKKLDYFCTCLLRENAYLKEIIARSGNVYLVKNADMWQRENRELKQKNTSLQAQIEEERAMHRIETMELEHRADYYEHKYNEFMELNNQKVNRNRDTSTGKFKSKDGIPKTEKMTKAYELFKQGFGYSDIAVKLNVSVDTAKRYIQIGHRHETTNESIRNFEERKRKLEYVYGLADAN